MTSILINAYEVPPEADDAFVRARDRMATRQGVGPTALYRALRRDTALRFVEVARVDAPAEFPARALPFTAHPGLYEVAHEDGTPDGAGGVVLVNPFEVPTGQDERFLAGWDSARDTLAGRPGYLGTRLHRSLGPADFRFVNIARWSSPLAFSKAVQRPEFQHAAAAVPFASHPALYVVVAG